jgi:predicted alpha/beta superfamily hydrolase
VGAKIPRRRRLSVARAALSAERRVGQGCCAGYAWLNGEYFMRHFGFTAIVISWAAFNSLAAHAALLPATHETIQSTVLGQPRAIEVSLPEESAKDPAQRYETLYVLDGDWNAKLVIQVADFMRQVGMIPPIIVVSVPNFFDAQGVNSRDHDLTPSSKPERQPRSGGARQFLDFIKTELIPYVDQHYPTNGTRLIHGHSYGGLFLVYALANEPQLFGGYLVLDPALWWDKPWLEGQVGDALKRLPTTGKALFVAGRSGDEFVGMGIDSYEAVLRANAPVTLPWRVTPYERETHDSLKLKATYDGLRFLFDGYSPEPVTLDPELGVLIPGHPLRFIVQYPGGIHPRYTTDGSEPSSESPEYTGEIGISDPGKTRLKVVSRRGDFDQAIPMKVVLGSAVPPLPASGAGEDSHWRYKLYTAGAPLAGHPLASGFADSELNLKVAKQPKVSGRLERIINVDEDGYYLFWVQADQSRVALNGKTLFETDEATHHHAHSYVAPLQRGHYALAIDFHQPHENSGLRVEVVRVTEEAPQWWRQTPWLRLATRED